MSLDLNQEKIQWCKLLYVWYLIKEAEWSLESTPVNVKHSANKEGTWSARLIKVYYTQNLAILSYSLRVAQVLFGATHECCLQSAKPYPSHVSVPGIWLPASWWLCKAIHPHHLHSHLQTGMSGSPGTSLSSLGLTCLELVSKLCGLNTAGHHRIARASYNACTPLTAFSSLFFSPYLRFDLWTLLLASRENWHSPWPCSFSCHVLVSSTVVLKAHGVFQWILHFLLHWSRKLDLGWMEGIFKLLPWRTESICYFIQTALQVVLEDCKGC